MRLYYFSLEIKIIIYQQSKHYIGNQISLDIEYSNKKFQFIQKLIKGKQKQQQTKQAVFKSTFLKEDQPKSRQKIQSLSIKCSKILIKFQIKSRRSLTRKTIRAGIMTYCIYALKIMKTIFITNTTKTRINKMLLYMKVTLSNSCSVKLKIILIIYFIHSFLVNQMSFSTKSLLNLNRILMRNKSFFKTYIAIQIKQKCCFKQSNKKQLILLTIKVIQIRYQIKFNNQCLPIKQSKNHLSSKFNLMPCNSLTKKQKLIARNIRLQVLHSKRVTLKLTIKNRLRMIQNLLSKIIKISFQKYTKTFKMIKLFIYLQMINKGHNLEAQQFQLVRNSSRQLISSILMKKIIIQTQQIQDQIQLIYLSRGGYLSLKCIKMKIKNKFLLHLQHLIKLKMLSIKLSLILLLIKQQIYSQINQPLIFIKMLIKYQTLHSKREISYLCFKIKLKMILNNSCKQNKISFQKQLKILQMIKLFIYSQMIKKDQILASQEYQSLLKNTNQLISSLLINFKLKIKQTLTTNQQIQLRYGGSQSKTCKTFIQDLVKLKMFFYKLSLILLLQYKQIMFYNKLSLIQLLTYNQICKLINQTLI
ncbi:hypothetical protein TTHERM_000599803 (macronuclear) [Tetrahymena thermophila SB210]|uniref:Uncharacterized protein n=1 Tax=Tetrahymena thermophila (strain SB210) TaxID=312017 RepID=W7XIF4_TETTS|nr:hypothetical protein TTHERM_000599803 [Tetrahymena thermophila SB210]EWS73244.1 hypothetical protein TTHERM_000599803 [Tetrahymena thermophila SB210]|eukprot:XP_012654208.1 hypothetical protein TTHERM_000599803 [Tetrahymena thermophila SB210]